MRYDGKFRARLSRRRFKSRERRERERVQLPDIAVEPDSIYFDHRSKLIFSLLILKCEMNRIFWIFFRKIFFCSASCVEKPTDPDFFFYILCE